MKDGTKLSELTLNSDGIRIRHANPNPLSANQKFAIIMSVIGAAPFIGFFAMMILKCTLSQGQNENML